jgi:hypothetical protein
MPLIEELHFSARVDQRPARQSGIRFGLVQPVGARIADAMQVTHWNVNPQIVVASARLDQQDFDVPVAGQAIGQDAAGSAGSDDDVVELTC